ncbi:MAG TPA: YtpI family protein [Candidatus Angelobacter sp.]|nr:YtpI family protein [Candidatus Angelobacter sp.]
MPTIVVFIVLSAVLFFLYRFRAISIKNQWEKKLTVAKANIAMGVFLISFGLNRLFLHPQTVTFVISGLFILYGLFFTYDHVRRSKYYYFEVKKHRGTGSGVNLSD